MTIARKKGHSHVVEMLSAASLWQSRRAYLSLVDGCLAARGHIARFLFDEMMCREVCSYMPLDVNTTDSDSDLDCDSNSNSDSDSVLP